MQIKVSKLVYIIVVVLSFGCTYNKAPQPLYEVISIADGDSFTILAEAKQQKRIRLFGIDCPERGQPFGANAKQKLSELIFRKNVTIEIEDTDRYGRAVAVVYTEDGACVNALMLASGFAWHYKEFDSNIQWSMLEEKARDQKLGLWSDANALPPWEWRKRKRHQEPALP